MFKNFYEFAFPKVCKLLGADLFKKYSPFFGSKWNKHHINKNNVDDLNKVIDDAWEYTRVHVGALTFETIVYSGMEIIGVDKRVSWWKIILFIGSLHGYVLMIHAYNRFLAKKQLGTLKKDDDTLKNEITQFVIPIGKEIRKIENRDFYVYQNTMYFYIIASKKTFSFYGPDFVSKEECIAFYEYLMFQKTDEEIYKLFFIDRCVGVYKEFLLKEKKDGCNNHSNYI